MCWRCRADRVDIEMTRSAHHQRREWEDAVEGVKNIIAVGAGRRRSQDHVAVTWRFALSQFGGPGSR